ncbi:MAG: hypothetical protein ACI37R_00130 [Candidatus Avigastranaerophilus sp.]
MKICKISAGTPSTVRFKGYDDSYNYDYATHHNNITIKDAALFSAIVSAVMLLGGVFFSKEDKISRLINKCKSKFNKIA